MLWSAADLNRTRIKFRVGNQKIYDLLCDIYRTALTTVADDGNEPRHEAASEEREWWTVQQLARATGLSTRKVRLDAQQGRVPADKHSGTWLIDKQNATTYIAAFKR